MNQSQFQQWKEFSTKAINALAVTETRKSKLKTNVAQFFEEVSNNLDLSDVERWEDVMDLFYDLFEEFRVNHDKEKTSSFRSQLHAVVRAGINIVSGDWGVVNWFTAGDIKSMFQGQVPDYVAKRFTSIAFDDDENILDF
jgi:uncharacterized Zn finger protein